MNRKTFSRNIIASFIFIIIISCNNKTISSYPPNNIKTVISLSPAITEILIDLNVSDKIIACDAYSKDILIKYNKERYNNIQSFDLSSPDAEKILFLKPDILMANSLSLFAGKEALDNIEKSGIYLSIIEYSKTIKDIKNDIIYISELFNKKEEALNIIENMDNIIDKINIISSNITNKKKIYFEIASNPSFYSFGSGVYLNEMIEIIGGKNIFEDKESWINVSEEIILNKNPDVILSSEDYLEDPVKDILKRKSWQNINAVKNKEVYYISNTSLANHNIIKALIEMGKKVYSNEYSTL